MKQPMDNVVVIRGNIFNSKAQTIVNTVNCVGVMGKGIALVFKLRYPDLFEKYSELCSQHLIQPGKLWIYKGADDAPWVLNFPTKYHWKYPSKMEYIVAGLEKFLDTYQEKGITSIAFPLLGTHNGGLDKKEVLEVMNMYLNQCSIPVEIYDYRPGDPDDLFESFKERWNSIPKEDLKSATGIRTKKQIETLDSAINSPQIQSMISLIDCPGIGLKTMEKCFDLVLHYEPNQQLF